MPDARGTGLARRRAPPESVELPQLLFGSFPLGDVFDGQQDQLGGLPITTRSRGRSAASCAGPIARSHG